MTALVLGAVLTLPLSTAVVAPAQADHARPPDDRRLVSYVVRPGDTASGLAVRFHAWTAELVSSNHLEPSGTLRVGERIVIPVVREHGVKHGGKHGGKDGRGGGKHGGKHGGKGHSSMWQHPDRDREKVRRVIAGAARHHDVDPQLALAIAWQESGWQMGVVSSAHAIGAMQVLPSTARWMEHYAGRRLRLHQLGDNAKAGVLLLRVLTHHTHRRTHKIGAYYQGLGAVREHGLFAETRTYVADVVAIKRRLEEGRPPA
ncbi:lytic transglycosylase domain-containing protein [Nocardioides baculatus]|uniref:Transglycosylase SLT domain-containing protein n=1 Tax=Nocardioides baculatus TaxID=2801337 RepID=A0ABS1L989_9ACTN|nr:transglycosylase SLT domain-containing protein [Nocardioides baculatus]MBL0747502.1 transglycosylase SLT domain-containing protein [Nocardioides baculatus]